MAQTVIPIESLPSATVVNGDDLLIIKQGGVTKKVTKTVLGISGYETTKLTFVSAGSQTYQVSRYEKVIGYTYLAPLTTNTIKITNNLNGEVYVDTTDDNARDFNYFTQASNSLQRVLKIEVDAISTVYIHSIKNLVP